MNWEFALFVAGALALIGFVCLNAYLGAELLRRGPLRANLLLHPAEALARLVFVGACGLLGWLSGLPAATLGWRLDDVGADVALGLGFGIVLQALNHLATRWAMRRYGREVYSPAFLRAILPRTPREWPLVALALLPAALAEEMMFRGLAVGGFSVFAPPLLLVVLFAAIFGLAHLPQGRLGVVGAAVLGFLLGAFFLWRWSVIACTVAHYTVNLVQLIRAKEELSWFDEEPEKTRPK